MGKKLLGYKDMGDSPLINLISVSSFLLQVASGWAWLWEVDTRGSYSSGSNTKVTEKFECQSVIFLLNLIVAVVCKD